MFPLFVKSLDMQNKEHVNTVLEYVNTACKYANIAPGYDSLGGIYKSEHTRPNTQLSYNLNCLVSRAKTVSTSSYIAPSDSDMQKYTNNSSSIPIIPLLYKFKEKYVEETVLANMSVSHVQNILLINKHLSVHVPHKDARGKL